MTTPPPPYDLINWLDDDPTTPLSAANLNKMDRAIQANRALALAAIPASMLGGPAAGGVSTLDAGGVNEQAPLPHGHTISVTDSGGTEQHVSGLDLFGGSGAFAVVGGRAQFKAIPADVRVYRCFSAQSIVGTGITLLTWKLQSTDVGTTGIPMNPGDNFDYELFLPVTSTTAAQCKAVLQGPIGATHIGEFFAPHTDMVSAFDYTKFRDTSILVPQNGQQSFGGFPAAGTGLVVAKQKGSFQLPSAAAAGVLKVLVSQVVGNGDTTTALAYGTKLILARGAAS